MIKMGVKNMLVNGYCKSNNCIYFDFENTTFCNNIKEILSFFYFDKTMQNKIINLWKKFIDKNKPYVIYIFGYGRGILGIFSRKNNLILYDGEKIPKWEHISDFSEWVNENFEISENVRLIEILLNNCDLFGV